MRAISWIGRRSGKKGASTAAERQARRRKRLRKTRSAVLNRQRAHKARDQQAEQYIPYPPGITYWRKVTLRAGETTEIMQPKTQPLPSIAGDLEDDGTPLAAGADHEAGAEAGPALMADYTHTIDRWDEATGEQIAANFSRTPPSPPRASAHSRGPHRDYMN